LLAIEGVDPETGKPMKDSEFPEDKAIEKLPKPYLADIIGNTICAGLLDYVLRNSYFTGLRQRQPSPVKTGGLPHLQPRAAITPAAARFDLSPASSNSITAGCGAHLVTCRAWRRGRAG